MKERSGRTFEERQPRLLDLGRLVKLGDEHSLSGAREGEESRFGAGKLCGEERQHKRGRRKVNFRTDVGASSETISMPGERNRE